jgi:hypothetical protein
MEAPSAGEGVDRLDDLRAGVLQALLGGLEVIGIEDDERHAGLCPIHRRKSALQPAVPELAIARAVFRERPAEGLVVKRLRARDVRDV